MHFPSANQHCRTVILATEYLWDLLGSLVEPCLWCSCYVYYHQGWRSQSSQSGFGQTTFLASRSHNARVPWRPLCIRVWNCCLWDVMYQIKPFNQPTCPSTSRVRPSRKPQSSGSEAQRYYKSPSRQLKNEGEKLFRASHDFYRCYVPRCTAFGSHGCTTSKYLAPPLTMCYVLCIPLCAMCYTCIQLCAAIVEHSIQFWGRGSCTNDWQQISGTVFTCQELVICEVFFLLTKLFREITGWLFPFDPTTYVWNLHICDLHCKYLFICNLNHTLHYCN